jgi:diguanylate cyclase (GGDEF)-like protein
MTESAGSPAGARAMTDTFIAQLASADTKHAVQIADRVWWVGHVLPDDVFQCHVYLLEQGDQSVLFDPGSRLTFAGTLRKIEEVIPFTHIRYFVCHHQDPDIAAALPLIDELVEREDAVVVTHWRSRALLKHYGLRLPFWLVDEHEWRLPLPDRELRFVFTPYAHFPGAFCSFDPRTNVLFSSDLFGGFTEKPALVAAGESHFEALRPFHEHYMPSRDILDFAISQIEQYPVRVIAPQHGSIIPPDLVPFMIDRLRHLDCGIYLFARENTDIQRLSRLNETLRDITRTMLLYRDFREIAERLFDVVRKNLPAERIDYHALLGDGSVLTLAREGRFIGAVGQAPEHITRLLGRTAEEWAVLHRESPALRSHRLHEGPFCSRPDGDRGLILTLPLFAPASGRMEGLAEIHLQDITTLPEGMILVVQQLTMPLQVALEREVIYRGIEAERQRAYERSIRDALTGLFTRVYMHDAVERQLRIDDRTPDIGLAAVMVDIDHFKRINDTHGHAAGDAVLRLLGEILQQRCRAGDIPVRVGGEEFVVFLTGTGAADAHAFAELLRAEIAAASCTIDAGVVLSITASFGVALRHADEPFDALMARADRALYHAKENGRNRVCIAPPADAAAPSG